MKLIDFSIEPSFVALVKKMGAENVFVSTIELTPHNKVTYDEILQIENGGLEIDIKDLHIDTETSTFTYKNEIRVLIHIRDIQSYFYSNWINDLPRYHITNCSTYTEFINKNKLNRFVVYNGDTDSNFTINKMNNNKIQETKKTSLKVCSNCMKKIKGYHTNILDLKEFWKTYGRNLIVSKPSHTSEDAQLHTYTKDWNIISAQFKEQYNYQCQQCGHKPSTEYDKRYIETHHINGIPYDNNPDNLKVLCVSCHAEQDGHNHMKNTPRYKEFVK